MSKWELSAYGHVVTKCQVFLGGIDSLRLHFQILFCVTIISILNLNDRAESDGVLTEYEIVEYHDAGW